MNCKVKRNIWDNVDQYPEQCNTLLLTVLMVFIQGVKPSIMRNWVIVITVGYFVTESCLLLLHSSLWLTEARKQIYSIILGDLALQFLKRGIILPLRFICSRWRTLFFNCFKTSHHPDCPFWDALFFVHVLPCGTQNSSCTPGVNFPEYS